MIDSFSRYEQYSSLQLSSKWTRKSDKVYHLQQIALKIVAHFLSTSRHVASTHLKRSCQCHFRRTTIFDSAEEFKQPSYVFTGHFYNLQLSISHQQRSQSLQKTPSFSFKADTEDNHTSYKQHISSQH